MRLNLADLASSLPKSRADLRIRGKRISRIGLTTPKIIYDGEYDVLFD
jgi:hypothetical protein